MDDKLYIGILDGGFEGINIFNRLVKDYPNERFVYLNDVDNYPYEGKEEKVILNAIKKSVGRLLAFGVSKILVVNNSLVEYGSEYFDTLDVKVLKVSDFIIDYVNEYYEHKNVGLLAKEYIVKANIYQKNIKYNHLYSIPSDAFDELIMNKEVKTAKSFNVVYETFQNVKSKDFNILIVTDSYLNNLRIEFNEYVKCDEIMDLSMLVSKKMKEYLSSTSRFKKKGVVLLTCKKKEFLDKAYFLDIKPKFKNIVDGE